jgi:hypothetical protein
MGRERTAGSGMLRAFVAKAMRPARPSRSGRASGRGRAARGLGMGGGGRRASALQRQGARRGWAAPPPGSASAGRVVRRAGVRRRPAVPAPAGSARYRPAARSCPTAPAARRCAPPRCDAPAFITWRIHPALFIRVGGARGRLACGPGPALRPRAIPAASAGRPCGADRGAGGLRFLGSIGASAPLLSKRGAADVRARGAGWPCRDSRSADAA